MSDEEMILVCAVRYALGRMSYMVGVVCGYVASHIDNLSEQCKKVIVRDIEEEIERYHLIGRTCGMECDEKDWLNLLEKLKGE